MTGQIVRSLLLNLFQIFAVLTLSACSKSFALHLLQGRRVIKDWPGDAGEELFCVASVILPLDRIRFGGTGSIDKFSDHPKYKFFHSVLNGVQPEVCAHFLGEDFREIDTEDKRMILGRKLEILRVAKQGDACFDIVGFLWWDGSVRIADGEHRVLALAALGKRRIRIGIVLENLNTFSNQPIGIQSIQ